MMMNGGVSEGLRQAVERFRVGSVPYLNAAPLTFGIEQVIRRMPPSALARELHAGGLDAALLSVTEALGRPGYRIVDDVGILSRGPVLSVFVAHRHPLGDASEVHVDTASCTSVRLMRVLMRARGWSPREIPLRSYAEAPERDPVLLIGNPAIDFRRSAPPHALWDLGEAWWEWTGLPFVYAVWVLREGMETTELPALLRQVAGQGLSRLADIRRHSVEYDPALREAYLGRAIQYDLDAAAKQGLQRFIGCLRELEPVSLRDPVWC